MGRLDGPVALEGQLWRVSAVRSPDGELEPVPAHVHPTARFQDGTISGSGGCNRYHGRYRLTGTALRVGPVAATLMACPGEAGAVEHALLTGLDAVASYALTADGVLLHDTAGDLVAALVPAGESALVGTRWAATGVDNGRGAVVSRRDDPVQTIVFAADGTVSGQDGEARFGGRYAVDGVGIQVGPFVADRLVADGPEPAHERARQFLAALQRATVWRVDGSRLELRDGAGGLQVGFTATRA